MFDTLQPFPWVVPCCTKSRSCTIYCFAFPFPSLIGLVSHLHLHPVSASGYHIADSAEKNQHTKCTNTQIARSHMPAACKLATNDGVDHNDGLGQTIVMPSSCPLHAVWSTVLTANVIAQSVWAPLQWVATDSICVATKITFAANPEPTQILQATGTRTALWAG